MNMTTKILTGKKKALTLKVSPPKGRDLLVR